MEQRHAQVTQGNSPRPPSGVFVPRTLRSIADNKAASLVKARNSAAGPRTSSIARPTSKAGSRLHAGCDRGLVQGNENPDEPRGGRVLLYRASSIFTPPIGASFIGGTRASPLPLAPAGLPAFSSSSRNGLMTSIGIGKMTVEF